MAEPNWELLEQFMRDIQTRLGRVQAKLQAHDVRFDQIDAELSDLKGMTKYALGAASGAEYQATNADRSVKQVSRKLDELAERVTALEDAR